MENRELLEWLGLTWADLCVYIGGGAVVAMFFVQNPTAEAALAAVGVAGTVAACPLGMRTKPEYSGLTNFFKLISYPLAVLGAGIAIAIHYQWLRL